MRSPLGFAPQTELPSGFLLELDTNVQVPTSCSLRVFCCAATSPTCKRARTSAVSAAKLIVRKLFMVLPPLAGAGMAHELTKIFARLPPYCNRRTLLLRIDAVL